MGSISCAQPLSPGLSLHFALNDHWLEGRNTLRTRSGKVLLALSSSIKFLPQSELDPVQHHHTYVPLERREELHAFLGGAGCLVLKQKSLASTWGAPGPYIWMQWATR